MVFPFLLILSRGMGTSVEMISFAVSIASMSAVFAPLLAQIGERFGKRTGMLTGILTFILSGFLVYFSNNFIGFFIGTLLLQLAINTFSPAMQAYISDNIPFEKRGMALSATELGWPLSFVLLVPLIALRIEEWGWNTIYLIFSLASIVFLVLIMAQTKKEPQNQTSPEHYRLPFGEIFRSGNAVLGLAIGFCIISANILVQLVFGLWLETGFSASATQIGLVSSVIGVAEFGGILVSILFIDRIGKHRAITIGVSAGIILTLIANFLDFTLVSAGAWLVLFFLLSEFSIVSTITFVSELFPQARNTYMALYSMMNAIGFGIASILAPIAYRYSIHGNITAALVMNIVVFVLLMAVKRPAKVLAQPAAAD